MFKRKGGTYSPSSYIPGENWMTCDICGHKFRASQMQRQPHGLWKGLWVCPHDSDNYNPQHENLSVRPEKISPDKVNPEGDSTHIGPDGGGQVVEGMIFSFPLAGDDPPEAPNYRTVYPVWGDGSHKITADDL